MTETNSLPAQVSELPKAPGRRRWVSLILTLVLFVSGVVVGAGSALLFVRNRALMRIRQPSEAVAMDTGRIQKSLALTDQQARKVETILLARQAAVYSAVQEEFDRIEDEVAGVLDEDQKPLWHARLGAFRKTWLPRKEKGTQLFSDHHSP